MRNSKKDFARLELELELYEEAVTLNLSTKYCINEILMQGVSCNRCKGNKLVITTYSD